MLCNVVGIALVNSTQGLQIIRLITSPFIKKAVLLYLLIPVSQNKPATEGGRAAYCPSCLFGGLFSHPKGSDPFYWLGQSVWSAFVQERMLQNWETLWVLRKQEPEEGVLPSCLETQLLATCWYNRILQSLAVPTLWETKGGRIKSTVHSTCHITTLYILFTPC